MNSIINKCRNLIEDNLVSTGRDLFEYTTSKIFTLIESNVSTSTVKVYKNQELWAGSNYSYSSETGKLTVTGTLIIGDVLEVTYSYYTKYSDNELMGFIRASFSHLSVEGYKTFTAKEDNVIFPTPTEPEENLIAVVTSILIKPNIRSYKTPEITIVYNDTDSKEQKIKKTLKQMKKTVGYLTYIDLEHKLVKEED